MFQLSPVCNDSVGDGFFTQYFFKYFFTAGSWEKGFKKQCTQGLIEILGSMVIFDENQAVSDINKYEFLYPIYAKIINFLVIWHHFDYFYINKWSENSSKSMKKGLRTRQFHRFWNCGLLSTSI